MPRRHRAGVNFGIIVTRPPAPNRSGVLSQIPKMNVICSGRSRRVSDEGRSSPCSTPSLAARRSWPSTTPLGFQSIPEVKTIRASPSKERSLRGRVPRQPTHGAGCTVEMQPDARRRHSPRPVRQPERQAWIGTATPPARQTPRKCGDVGAAVGDPDARSARSARCLNRAKAYPDPLRNVREFPVHSRLAPGWSITGRSRPRNASATNRARAALPAFPGKAGSRHARAARRPWLRAISMNRDLVRRAVALDLKVDGERLLKRLAPSP